MKKILNKINMLHKRRQRQGGAVLLIMLVIMIMGGTAILLNTLNSTTTRLARDKATADALAQAKEALIGYATSVALTGSNRPGDLPCPAIDISGVAGSACGSAAGSNQALRLGRLPWKTLGLPELRDGNGEQLWYAVSNNFKKNTRTALLNSDTMGTITVRVPDGSILNDGSGTSGAVAIIIAPGEVLTRQGSGAAQDRSNAGVNNPVNYLDIANGEDNTDFIDNASNGFIQGKINDANDKVILNDQILIISQDQMMQAIQKRVIGEVRNCLTGYANSNGGRFPWAAPITDTTNFFDQSNIVFGRIPDTMMNAKSDSSNTMSNQWPGACNTHTTFTANPWWTQWRELVFYGLSDKFKPDSTIAPDFVSICAIAGNCVSINNSNNPAKYVVVIAGKILPNPDQSLRNINQSSAFYYLEGGNENANQSGAYTFTQSSPVANYNDSVVY